MTNINHDEFISAIHNLNLVQVRFQSADDGGAILTRICAPMDYGPSRKFKDGIDRYHVWDFDSDSGKPHTLSLNPIQIVSFEVLEDEFDPSSFVTWPSNWIVPRGTWGEHN